MKFPLAPIAISIVCVAQPVQADIASDTTQIMTLITQLFPNEFSADQPILTYDTVWLYRTGKTGVIVGVNQVNGDVYLLGGVIGADPVLVGSSSEVVALLQGQQGSAGHVNTGNVSDICNINSMPAGYSYSRSGNVVTISTNGQCIVPPENRNFCEAAPAVDASGNPVATGLHVLTKTNVGNFNFSGLQYNIPGMGNPLDAVAQGLANTGSCIINAPADFVNVTINTDICFDMTNQLNGLTSVPGLLTITPPVTASFKGVSDISAVNDCFATGANSITDVVTKEAWILTNGSYVKVK